MIMTHSTEIQELYMSIAFKQLHYVDNEMQWQRQQKNTILGVHVSYLLHTSLTARI